MTTRIPTFWQWFFQGTGGRPGAHRLADRWLLVHVLVGALLAAVVPVDVASIAEKALLPLMAIFVGLTFSWAGNAHSLMQSDEVLNMAKRRKGGMAEYVYTFQLCLLVMLVTITCWVLPALKIPYFISSGIGYSCFQWIAASFLYFLLSLSLRSSWQAVLGANMLLLSRASIRERE